MKIKLDTIIEITIMLVVFIPSVYIMYEIIVFNSTR